MVKCLASRQPGFLVGRLRLLLAEVPTQQATHTYTQ